MMKLRIISLCLNTICICGCRHANVDPEIVIEIKYQSNKAIPNIGVDGPIARGEHLLSEYGHVSARQMFVDDMEYRVVSVGGGMNPSGEFATKLVTFSISAINADGTRELFLDTKVRCQIKLIPENMWALVPSEIVPQDNMFEKGAYSLRLTSDDKDS